MLSLSELVRIYFVSVRRNTWGKSRGLTAGGGPGRKTTPSEVLGVGRKSSSGRQESGRPVVRPAASGGAAGRARLPRWPRAASPAGG